MENDPAKILRTFQLQPERHVMANQPNIVVMDKVDTKAEVIGLEGTTLMSIHKWSCSKQMGLKIKKFQFVAVLHFCQSFDFILMYFAVDNVASRLN